MPATTTRPQWHRLGLSTVTPTFVGQFPDMQTTQAEIAFPIPSLRGVLAYWLRALAGPYIGSDISELLRLETELFGAAATEQLKRPSRILFRGGRVSTGALLNPTPDLAYLMGPGLTDDKAPAARRLPTMLPAEVKNTGSPSHADLFLSALWALRAFGGLGARSRRGFGTLAINGDLVLKLPKTRHFDLHWLRRDHLADLENVLGCVETVLTECDFRRGGFSSEPRYPCFVADRFHFKEHSLDGFSQPKDALTEVGKLLRDFRHPRPDGWKPPEDGPWQRPKTAGYEQVAYPYVHRERPTAPFAPTAPILAGALGLPISYTVERHNDPVTVEPIDSSGASGRRASPLWLRVTSVSGWRLRSLVFHDEWLPQGTDLRIKTKGLPPGEVDRPSPEDVKGTLNGWFAYLAARLPEVE